MNFSSEIEAILNGFIDKVVAGIKDNIRNKQVTKFGAMNASGTAAESIRGQIRGNRIVIYSEGKAASYIMNLEHGIAPNEVRIESDTTESMVSWMNIRGINGSAKGILKSINKKGSTLWRQGGNSGILSDFTNEKYIKENFTDLLAEALASEFVKKLAA